MIGYIAALLSVCAFAPQAWRVLKTRDTKDLSTPMWVLEVCAFALWIAYGVQHEAWAIILPNSVCLVFATFILVMNLLPDRKKNEVADKLTPSGSPSRSR